ncbi:MAG TPA: cyclodeaminase/cyclohydrolase family protein [Methylomirabilota bacterium]|nr:cyclodeaminase/cyclohydrolase family protein [Methylomirabilota bacterium]
MHDQSIGTWLDALASSAPAPGGGAAAALSAAIGAALIEMVCNLTIGRPRYAAHEALMREALARATTLRHRALGLAAADASAFGAVTDAYRLPRDTDEQARVRAERIQGALIRATEVPLETAALAGEVVQLAGRIVDGANVNALADIAAAAASARAALETALVNVEANLAALPDRSRGRELRERSTGVATLVAEAERTIRRIRGKVGE